MVPGSELVLRRVGMNPRRTGLLRVLRERADLAAELERLLLIVIHFLPRLAAKVRLRMADERLGAWATGLSDPQDPVVAAARERAAEAQRATTTARAAASANWRQAGDAARLATRLVSEAVTVPVVASVSRLAIAAGATFAEAARLANYAGGLVVMKRGTATVTAPGGALGGTAAAPARS